MPRTDRSRRLLNLSQKGFETEFSEVLKGSAETISSIIRKNSSDGVISKEKSSSIRRFASQVITEVFLGSDGKSAFADDGVTGVSAYAKLLNKWYVHTVSGAVLLQTKEMKSLLPEEVFEWLSKSRRRSSRQREAASPVVHALRLLIFHADPLAIFEPMHTWVDPAGYRLSERIWRSAQKTREKLDMLLEESIAAGMGSEALSRLLTRFLLPTRANLRTTKPYGVDASFDAMRLARTEISHAHAFASWAASQGNPFVETMEWCLSASHPREDICDQLATIGMSGERLRQAYPIESARLPPAHPHCLCHARPGDIVDADVLADALKQLVALDPDLRPDPYMNTAAGTDFVLAMIGSSFKSILDDLVLTYG